MSVIVVIPSRGRPERAWAAVDAALEMSTLKDTEVWLAIDADDPKLYRYMDRPPHGSTHVFVAEPSKTGNLVRITNTVSTMLAERAGAIIGNLGDDHVVRTAGWDARIAEALSTPGIAYGDDLIQSERLPTAPFISAEIVRALGWYALPACSHMYIDDAWKALGKELGVLRYLPDVVIEHMHPGVAKAEWDPGYTKADESTHDDAEAYFKWRNTTFHKDVANVRKALA